MWSLDELCAPWLDSACASISIKDISNQSKAVTQGTLFLAYKNQLCDRIEFLDEAVALGAAAVLIDAGRDDEANILKKYNKKIPVVVIKNLSSIYGEIAARFYHNPTAQMTVIGVTGTNGKSSTAYYIAQSFNLLHKKCAFIGTFGIGLPDHLTVSPLTTLDPIALQKQAASFLEQGVEVLLIEMSSHALDQQRLVGVHVNTTVLTQVTTDHLDYHKTLQNYHAAKEKSMQLPGLNHAVLNIDDYLGKQWFDRYHQQLDIITYGKAELPHLQNYLHIKHVAFLKDYLLITYHYLTEFVVKVPLIGSFNVENISACIATLLLYQCSIDDIKKIIPTLKGAPGRMQKFAASGKPTVFVDYAHTEDGLEKVFHALKEHHCEHLTVIFGCGGDRDATKRAPMGRVATKFADKIVLTNDNPRTEDPQQIIDQIVEGIKATDFDFNQLRVELDRQKCIVETLENANKDDVILIAGKGHETTQKMNGYTIGCDDREIVKQLLSHTAK